jgi:hypothetical protein
MAAPVPEAIDIPLKSVIRQLIQMQQSHNYVV